MTNHSELDRVIDSLLAESGLSPEARSPPPPPPPPKPDHWLRTSMQTGPVALPPPSRR